MAEPEIIYDEGGDTLYISFIPGEDGSGLDLNDHVLLRVDRRNRRAVGITLISFSLLANRSDDRPRGLPLSGLNELSPRLRELALEILRSPPVSDYLVLTGAAGGARAVPNVTVNTDKLVARAA